MTKLISWNVNGLRACVGKNFLDFFHEADADVFFFDFYVALGCQLFQTGQNLPSAHLHPPANLGDSDQGVLFCKRAKLLQHVFLDFSFG